MSVTCNFSGRLGNIAFNICQVIAYAKKHDLDYWFPNYAWACPNGVPTIMVPSTGQQPMNPQVYQEPTIEGCPYYHDIPKMDNVEFRGYYQSFKYFDDYRQDILDVFNLPHETEYGVTCLSVRRGDCIGQEKAFPLAPMEYYHKAVEYMQERGYNRFRISSDDIPWCKEEFTTERYPRAVFEFFEESDVLKKFVSMSQCEHHICARSTYDLTSSWFNQNPNKIVLCPSIEQHYWWLNCNKDLLTGTENWLTQLTW